MTRIADLRGKRIGWVSKLSAAGYVMPRLFLEAMGMMPEGLFAEERLAGTHARLASMLLSGEVDAIATYALFHSQRTGFQLPAGLENEALLATVGPIPGDLFIAGTRIYCRTVEALRGGLLGMRPTPGGALAEWMNIERFEVATAAHLEPIPRWKGRALDAALRFTLPGAPASVQPLPGTSQPQPGGRRT